MTLRETLQEIIINAQKSRRPTGIPRRVEIPRLKGKATIVTGARRAGKSTLIEQIIREKRLNGIDDESFLYVNFFDDRLHSIRHGGIGQVLDAYYSLYPERKDASRLYLFFDEVQMVDGWEPFVDRVLREENAEVYLTGSSSKLLSTEIATEMRGRALPVELFPFSMLEWMDARGINETPRSSRWRYAAQKVFDEYWERGGFPEVLDAPAELRRAVHQEYFKTIVHRDVVERFDARHPRAIFDMAHQLIDNCGSMYSVNRLTGHLKSYGHKIHKSVVSEAMGWFEDAFLLFSVELFSASRSRRETNPRKIYCIDHALVRSVSPGMLVNSGHLLENIVFLNLRRRGLKPYYYRTAAGREVDFVYIGAGDVREIVQVAYSLEDPDTREREISAAREAMEELERDTATVVSMHESGETDTGRGTIRIVPAWSFLLEQGS